METYPQALRGGLGSTVPAQPSRVNSLMGEREKLQGALRERIGRLEGRLNPILTVAPEQATRNGEDKIHPVGNHGDAIQIANQDLEGLVHWVENIESRLEL